MGFIPDFTPPKDVELHEHDSTTSWVQDGIFCIHAKPGVKHTLEEAKKQMALATSLFQDRVTVALDIRQAPPIDIKARNYYGSDEASQHVGYICIIVDSPFSKVIGNFYMGIFKKKVPTKLFTSGPEAMDWARSLKHKQCPSTE